MRSRNKKQRIIGLKMRLMIKYCLNSLSLELENTQIVVLIGITISSPFSAAQKHIFLVKCNNSSSKFIFTLLEERKMHTQLIHIYIPTSNSLSKISSLNKILSNNHKFKRYHKHIQNIQIIQNLKMEIEEPITKPLIPSAKIPCYFSEINDIAEEIGFHTLEEMRIPTQPLHMVKTKRPNCYAEVKDWGLVIVSKGGAHFNIPLEEAIQTIYPMTEGLLIQFTIKQEPKFSEILHLQRNKLNIHTEHIIEEAKYSYVTINKHPLNALKLLNCLKNGELAPWKSLQEEIIYVDKHIPLMISYNHALQRNAFHLLRINPEQIRREDENITFLNNVYTLKAVGDSVYNSGEVVSQLFYEQNTREQKMGNVLLCKAKNNNQIVLNALYTGNDSQTLKVFLVKLLSNCETIEIGKYSNVIFAQTFDLFDPEVQFHSLFQPQQEPINQLKDLNTHIVMRQLKNLKQFLVGIHSQSYFLMFNGHLVYTFSLTNSEGRVHSINKLGDDLLQIRTNKANIKLSHVKKIKNPLVLSILNILSEVIPQSLYVNMLKNYINLKQNRDKFKSQFQILKQYLISLYTGLIDPTILKFKNIHKIQQDIKRILHLLYQQMKLFEYDRHTQQLLDLLFTISVTDPGADRYLYCDYYLREGANNHLKISIPTNINTIDNYEPIPDIFKFIEELIKSHKDQKQISLESSLLSMPVAFKRTKFVVRLLQTLIDGEIGKRSQIPEYVLNRNLNSMITNKHLENSYFPIFVQCAFQMKKYYFKKMQGFIDLREMLQLKEVEKQQKAYLYIIEKGMTLQQIKTYPSAVSIIIYEILRMMRDYLPGVLYSTIPQLGFNLIKRQDIYRNIKFYKRATIKPPEHLQNNTLQSAIQSLIHSSDSESYYLNSNPFEMNKLNNDLIFEQVNRLLSSTDQIVIKHKELQNIPEDKWEQQSQSIVAKFANRRLSVLVGQGAFTWGTSQTFITQMVKIPKINLSALMPNDVKVTLDLKQDKQSTIHWAQFHNGVAAGLRLSRHIIPLSQDHLKTWIFYQKPQNPKRDHSGFLLALGLMGYLKCFSPTDIYQYLKPNNELTSIALLLGVSSSHIGKCQQYITQTLVIHVLPSTIDMDIPINVQTAALIGIGFIHKGTCNRTMTEMALSQIGRSPNNDKCLDRQGYSLAAGWALGLTCLGSAGQRSHLDDLQLQKRFIRYIEGGRVMQPPQTMISNSFARQNKCSSIKQGPNVNLHITAPAALMAISLMYLKSNNKKISNQITIPQSFNMIEQCNPNLILLKVIAKNIIMWKDIDNTSDFLYNQIPQLVRFIFESSLQKVHESYYLVYNVNQIDYHTISTIYASTLTGAVVGMGLKYAGTGDQKAISVIKEHIEKLVTMKILKYELANDPINKNCIDQYTLFTLLSTSILALSIVVAGTCDVQCLRIARSLRKRIQDAHNFHYGFNMAINMAIGFICLGYGNYSFNRSDLAIACLLISIYPMFPNSPVDNKWHLQALRHLYVLAVQQKVFHAVDVDTNKVVNAKVEMTFLIGNETKKQKLSTPILLQESKKLLSIRVIDDNFYNIDLTFEEGTLKEPRVIYIKRKLGKSLNSSEFDSLTMADNPEEPKINTLFQKQVHFQSLKSLDNTILKPHQLLHMLPQSEYMIQAINKLCHPFFKNVNLRELYYQFLKQDRLQILQIYLDLIRNTNIDTLSLSKIQNISVLDAFYKSSKLIKAIHPQQSKFFSLTSFGSLKKNYDVIVESQFNKLLASGEFSKYIKQVSQLNNQVPTKLMKIMKYLNIPNRYQLQVIGSFLKKVVGQIKSKITKEDEKRRLSSKFQMYLFVSFPNCSLNVIDRIIEAHLEQI